MKKFKQIAIFAFIFLIFTTTPIPAFSQIDSPVIPTWIKNNAGWWAEGAIDDNSFVQGIQFLIKEGIMKIQTQEIPKKQYFESFPSFSPEESENIVIYSNYVNPEFYGLYLDNVPAIEIPNEIPKNVLLNNYINFHIVNTGTEKIHINKIILEASNPEDKFVFSHCDPQMFPSFTLQPGHSINSFSCFFPVSQSVSSVNWLFLDDFGKTIFSIPFTGIGREMISSDQIFGMLFLATPTVPIMIFPSLTTVTEAGCPITLEGGGEIPNQAVTGRPSNTHSPSSLEAPVVNVGEKIKLEDTICTGATWVKSKWTIPGDVIKDYTVNVASGTVTEIPLTAGDLDNRKIEFYWKTPGNKEVILDITITFNGATINKQIKYTFQVERNSSDHERQVEDYYSFYHTADTLVEHYSWHDNNRWRSCTNNAGVDLFDFHRNVIKAVNDYRTIFGYPTVTKTWDMNTPVPTSTAETHQTRSPNTSAFMAKPTYLTISGGTDAHHCFPTNKKLADFTPDQLGTATETPYHNAGHRFIGGDMASWSSPKDPVFFQWHNHIESIFQSYNGTRSP